MIDGIFVSLLRRFVGVPPVGLEFLEYTGSLILFLILFRFVADFFRFFSRLFGSKN